MKMTINDIERQLDFYTKVMGGIFKQLKIEEAEISYDRDTNSVIVWAAKHILDEPCSNEIYIPCKKNLDLTQIKLAKKKMTANWDVITATVIEQRYNKIHTGHR